ncbi:MAG: hypothetical protein QGG36_08195 [Pirellulaceae bacterium]|nr:hypothetical protein [Pirellulaceae bacterium]MDP7015764.1 hypothetical protein [Pirellulaceae bacterium]
MATAVTAALVTGPAAMVRRSVVARPVVLSTVAMSGQMGPGRQQPPALQLLEKQRSRVMFGLFSSAT